MRRPFVVKAGPTTNLGGLGETFAQMYNAVPGPAERAQQQAQLATQQAQGDYYSARADKVRQEAQQAAAQREARRGIADVYGEMSTDPADFHPSGAHPSQQHRTDAPKTDPQNSVDRWEEDQLAAAAEEAWQIGTAAGTPPDKLSRIIRDGLAAKGGSHDLMMRYAFAAENDGTIGVNDAVSMGDRERVAARNAMNDRRLAVTQAQAKPLSASAGETVRPGVGDPRGTLYGRDTASTAEAGLINRAAGGEQLNPQQAAIAGADGSAGPNKQRIALRGPNGGERSGYFDPGAGTYHFATGERVPEGWRAYNQPQPQGSNEELGFENSELKSTRQEILNRRSATKQAVATVDEISGRLQQAEDPAQIVGIVGGASGLLNDMAAQAKAAMRLTGIEIEAPGDAAAYEGTFRELGIENRQMQAAFLDLAYSIAQSRESGRLTEADISRALRTVGANSQDPVAMAQVLQSARNRLVRNYQLFEGTAREMYGDELNVDPWRPQGGQQQGSPAGASPAPGGGQRGGASGQPGTGGGNGGVPVIDLDGNRIE